MEEKIKASAKLYRQRIAELEQQRRQVKLLGPDDTVVAVRGGKRLRVETNSKLSTLPMEIDDHEEDREERPVCTYPLGRGAIHLYGTDVARLDEGRFLNDQIVNIVLKWMYDTTLSRPNKELAHLCDSHLYSEVIRGVDTRNLEAGQGTMRENIERVSKWFSKTNGLTKNLVIIPICEENHWFLAVLINEPSQITRVLLMDSLPGTPRTHVGRVLQHLIEHVSPGRTCTTIDVQVNRQPNLYDCGVHVLNNAWALLKYVDTHPRCELAEVEARLADRTMTRGELRTLIQQIGSTLQQQHAHPKLKQQESKISTITTQQLQIGLQQLQTTTQQSPITTPQSPIVLQQLQTTAQQSPITTPQSPIVRQQLQTTTQQSHITTPQSSIGIQQLQITTQQSPITTPQSSIALQQPQMTPQPQQEVTPPRVLQPGEGYDIEQTIHLMNRTGKDWAVPDELEGMLTHIVEETRETIHMGNRRRRAFIKETYYGTYRFQINRTSGRCLILKTSD